MNLSDSEKQLDMMGVNDSLEQLVTTWDIDMIARHTKGDRPWVVASNTHTGQYHGDTLKHAVNMFVLSKLGM